MTTEIDRSAGKSTKYTKERVDALPFNNAEKSDRYRTERFAGAIGLNWYDADPTLQRSVRYYLTADEMEWAEPRLSDLGALMGGPIAERAELTDKDPPQLIKYDRWGHDVSEVRIAESAKQTKRDLIEKGFMGPDFPMRSRLRGRADRPAEHGPRLPAEPGRDRHVLRDGRGRRHGRGAGDALRTAGCARPRALEARLGRVDRPHRAVLHRAHRRLRPRRPRDDGHAAGRRLGAQRLQVVRLEPRWRGLRRPGEAGGRAGRHQGDHPLPRPQAQARRQPQRRQNPPAKGEARHARRRLGRDRVRGRRSVHALRPARRVVGQLAERRPGDGAADGDDERRPARRRPHGPRLRSPRARGVSVLRAGPELLGHAARPAPADEAKARRDDRRRRGRAGAPVRRVRLR